MKLLTRHFFAALFDFGILSTAGADSFRHLLLGAGGGIFAFGLVVTYLYAGKYSMLWAGPFERYRLAVLGDDLLLIGLPMVAVAFITLLVSHSLFPDERDCRILGPLPVSRGTVFTAKLGALGLFGGLFIAVMHLALLPLAILTSINPWGGRGFAARIVTWLVTSVPASLFAMLAIAAITGVATLLFQGLRSQALTGVVRSGMLVLLVLAAPVVLRLPNAGVAFAHGAAWLRFAPPAWFAGVQQVLRGSDNPVFRGLAMTAVVMLLSAGAIVAIVHAVLYRHFERLMLRPVMTTPGGKGTMPRWDFGRAVPEFRAIHRFTLLTLWRSQLHQGVLVGISAVGAGIVAIRLIDAGLAPAALAGAALWTPFALMFVLGLGARAALALPMDQRANWIFRLTEDGAVRHEQLRAVEQVVAIYVVGLAVLVALPLLSLASAGDVWLATLIVALVGLVFMHAVLLDWRRIPFTCSYLPGKRFAAQSFMWGLAGFVVFGMAGVRLVRAAAAGPGAAVAIVGGLAVAAWFLKQRRITFWRRTPLLFEDEFPDRPQDFRLS